MVERMHRTLKSALMCQALALWTDALPTVLLGLRTSVKEDIKASPAEMLYGGPLRVPGAFISPEDEPLDARTFFDKHREIIKSVRPTPTAIHAKNRCFVMKDLCSCSHVFRRVDSVRHPLEPPHTGPHEIVKRVNDRVFILRIDGVEKGVSVEALKPVFTAKSDHATTRYNQEIEARPSFQRATQHTSCTSAPTITPGTSVIKHVSFPEHTARVTGGGIAVVVRSSINRRQMAQQ